MNKIIDYLFKVSNVNDFYYIKEGLIKRSIILLFLISASLLAMDFTIHLNLLNNNSAIFVLLTLVIFSFFVKFRKIELAVNCAIILEFTRHLTININRDLTIFFINVMFSLLVAGVVYVKRYQYISFAIAEIFLIFLKSKLFPKTNVIEYTYIIIFLAGVALFIYYLAEKLNAGIHKDIELSRENDKMELLIKEIRKNKKDLKKILNIEKIGNWKYNFKNNDFFLSSEGYNILEISEDTIIHTFEEYYNFIIPEDQPAFKKATENCVNNKIEYKIEYKIKTSDEKIKQIREQTEIEYDENNEPLYMFGIIKDITSIKDAEMNFILTYKVFEASKDGIMVTDIDKNILYVNEALCQMTGFSRDELIGKNPRILKSNRHGKEFYDQLTLDLRDKDFWEGELWDKRKNGTIYPKWMNINTIRDDKGKILYYVSVSTDLSSLREKEMSIQRLSNFDIVTELPNQYSTIEMLKNNIKKSAPDRKICFIVLNIKNFKRINDVFGYNEGTNILLEVASRLKTFSDKNIEIGKLGSDEFAVIIKNADSMETALHIFSKINNYLNEPFRLNNKNIELNFKYGISFYPDDAENESTLFQNALTALHYAKLSPESLYEFFTREMNNKAIEKMNIEMELKKAIASNEFKLLYQPQVDLKTGKIIGVEALLRWHSVTFGMISPSKFIPIAEESKLIIELGEWILEEACRQNKAWLKKGLRPITMSVNLSAIQFKEKDLVSRIVEILEKTALFSDSLELEITEGVTVENTDFVIDKLKEIKQLGIRIAIDDFGTGYSSLSYIKNFPIDKLKIDRSFVKDIPELDNGSIAKTIIELSHNLSFKVIAEGAETDEQIDFLRNNNCDLVQGYYFYKPLEPEKIEELLAADK